MDDPFLNYLALGLLFFVVIVLVYGIIAIHDIPARIAKARHHPHEDAIHAAGWISLFMLHVLWPFLWIWAMMYRPERGWGFDHQPSQLVTPAEAEADLEKLRERLAEIEAKLEAGER
jgi:type VI protein secretion system component VasK